MYSIKRQKDMAPEDEPLGQYMSNILLGKSKEIVSERMKRLGQSRNSAPLCMCLVVKVLRCCKEQCSIGTWNVRSMNHHKLDKVRQEMARVDIDVLGISELKCIGMGEFNSDTIISTTVGKNLLEEMEWLS